jgi:ribonuclease HII
VAKSIKTIGDEVKKMSLEDQLSFVDLHQEDSRKGIQKIIQGIVKRHEDDKNEQKRLFEMTKFEMMVKNKGYHTIAGIDEVGRGPLAGPVVACAVILKEWMIYDGINDSKKVSLKNRLRLYESINETALEVSYGRASPEEIDQLNILNATKLAMKRAVGNLKIKPDYLLIDAVKLKDIQLPQENIIKGDEKSVSIAAASIMAKVTRDQEMIDYDQVYPGYDFLNNKGYGTASHYVGLNALGPSLIHRKTFIKDYI